MIDARKFQPLADKILIDILDKGEQVLDSGLIIPDDNMKEWGIRPRWCVVMAIGPDVYDVSVGDKVLVGHGDWTRQTGSYLYEGKERPGWITIEENILLVRT